MSSCCCVVCAHTHIYNVRTTPLPKSVVSSYPPLSPAGFSYGIDLFRGWEPFRDTRSVATSFTTTTANHVYIYIYSG
jgi:hypothetical protein